MDPLKGAKMPDELQTDDVMVQGDSYDEDDYYEEGTSGNDTASTADDETRAKKQKAAKLYVLIAVLAVVFIGVIIVVFMMMSGRSGGSGVAGILGGNDDSSETEGMITITWNGQEMQVPVDEYGQPIYPTFAYTADEIANLRKVGYTGDEIESYEQQSMPASDLISQAEAEREAWVQEAVAPYFDTASEEWKNFMNTTWYGLPKVESYNPDPLSSQIINYTLNADYEKVESYGHQLFIKIYLNAEGDYAFMITTPDRYAELADSGNMVVNITYTQTGDGQKFITNIVEDRVD